MPHSQGVSSNLYPEANPRIDSYLCKMHSNVNIINVHKLRPGSQFQYNRLMSQSFQAKMMCITCGTCCGEVISRLLMDREQRVTMRWGG